MTITALWAASLAGDPTVKWASSEQLPMTTRGASLSTGATRWASCAIGRRPGPLIWWGSRSLTVRRPGSAFHRPSVGIVQADRGRRDAPVDNGNSSDGLPVEGTATHLHAAAEGTRWASLGRRPSEWRKALPTARQWAAPATGPAPDTAPAADGWTSRMGGRRAGLMDTGRVPMDLGAVIHRGAAGSIGTRGVRRVSVGRRGCARSWSWPAGAWRRTGRPSRTSGRSSTRRGSFRGQRRDTGDNPPRCPGRTAGCPPDR